MPMPIAHATANANVTQPHVVGEGATKHTSSPPWGNRVGKQAASTTTHHHRH